MNTQSLFRDRKQAGGELARALARFRGPDTVVLGLPRGGMPVAYEVAKALEAPLDVCVVRKIGTAMKPDLGVGAVAECGAVFVRRSLATAYGLQDEQLEDAVRQKQGEVAERAQRFRRGMTPIEVRGKTVLVVDDGVASGSTARAALHCLRQRGAKKLVFAVPIGPIQEIRELASAADEVVCLHPQTNFVAIALGYDDFSPVLDEQVVALLQPPTGAAPLSGRPALRSGRA